jgi:hypothetical protein
LQRPEDRVEVVVAEVVGDRLERPQLGLHEAAHPVELRLELGLGGEIPGHGSKLAAGRRECTIGGG